jgi:hypothetical protein
MSGTVLGVEPAPGVDVNGVIYRYTAVKNPDDPYTVSIQNEDAYGSGYIFRSTDDWSGKSGTTITKYVPVPYTPLERFGDGSIDTVGIGSVQDPTVVYTYRVTPQEPVVELPELPEIHVYDALNDESVGLAMQETDRELFENNEEINKSEKDEEEDSRLETALAATENALTMGNALSQSALVQAMNVATNLNAYYATNIDGGAYKDALSLKDSSIPDNRRALRNMAQQKLHSEMVDAQYRR